MSNSSDERKRFSERRSSVRVRSLLPCSLRIIEEDEINALEARILDIAVIESESAMSESVDWSERTDDLPREVTFVLNEIRALRQQITEMQRLVERQGSNSVEPRWLVINDQGFWYKLEDDDPEMSPGTYLEVKLQIPSIHNPDILAVGEVVRISKEDGERGAGIEFRAISQLHKKAIIRYALRRERQLARSGRFPVVRNDD
ncbi:MAG: hypothetical protein ACQEVA_13965 [Myxococcota bacterium]